MKEEEVFEDLGLYDIAGGVDNAAIGFGISLEAFLCAVREGRMDTQALEVVVTCLAETSGIIDSALDELFEIEV